MSARLLRKFAAASAFFVGASAVSSALSQTRADISPEHRANITAISERICTAAQVKPCRMVWFGKNKAALPSDVLERMGRAEWFAALPMSEWTVRDSVQSRQFSNGRYTVVYGLPHGHIVISPVE
jgi:hypothetical protein